MMIVAMLLTATSPALAQNAPHPDFNVGPDLGGTGHDAFNFTGSAGSRGATWIAVSDEPVGAQTNFMGFILSADVLIHAWNNKKGAGLLAFYNEAPTSKKGLALTLYSAGNTDTLVLATVDQAGKLVTLKAVRLGAAIVEDVWYRVSMAVDVGGGSVSVSGSVSEHAIPTDPHSGLTTQLGPSLNFSAPLDTGGAGISATGKVGILAAAVSAATSSSVTNFEYIPIVFD